MKLTDAQREELHRALLDAFPTYGDLERMLLLKVGKHLGQEAMGEDLEQIVLRLIRKAESRSWHLQLIQSAREDNPRNVALTRFHERFFSLPSKLEPGRSLEAIVRGSNAFLDLGQFLQRLMQRMRCVCRIDRNGQPLGTGFLIGPEVVLTNHHVIQGLLAGGVPGAQLSVIFDYQGSGDGRSVGPGKSYRLADTWVLGAAPHSPLDEVPEPKGGDPDPAHLDFALLRVQGNPGKEPMQGGERGWIPLPEGRPQVTPGGPLCILQHPGGQPLQLAIDTNAIVGLNANETRLKYKTNTLPGSSGSPCFNLEWELVAVHHSGAPGLAPTYNEGIPIHTLRKHFIDQGWGALLGAAA